MNKNFLQEVASSQISEVQNPDEFSSDKLQLPEMQPTPRGPNRTPRQTLWEFYTHKLDKIIAGQKRSSIMPDSVKCVLYIRREVKNHI
jgi:hypothetical protein